MTPTTCARCGHTLPVENILQDKKTGKARGRCKQCNIWIPILLPSICKKLVYLDQSLLSAACLRVDNSKSKNEVRILSKLKELKVKQRIFVVVSDIHSRETSAIPDKRIGNREKLWQFQNELADGNIARDSDEVFIAQRRRMFDDRENSNFFPATDIGLDDPHRLQVGMKVQLTNHWRPTLHRDYARPRDTVNEKFRGIIERQMENMPNCKDVRDCLSYIRVLWRKDIRQGIVDFQQRRETNEWIIKEHKAGRNVDDSLLKTTDVPFSRIVREVVQGLDEESTHKRWLELLEGDSVNLGAHVMISSVLEAALLWKWKTEGDTVNTKKFHTKFGQSRQNDVDHIATFVPYVDALTTDDDMRKLCEIDVVADELKRFSCKIYSKSNYDEFEAWLDALLAEPMTHNVRV